MRRARFRGTASPRQSEDRIRSRERLRDFRDDRLEQRDKLSLDAFGGFKDFDMIERLIENARGGVRHARDSEDAKAAVAGGNHFGNGGHADEVRANRAKITDFGGSFVAGPQEGGIDALGHLDAKR